MSDIPVQCPACSNQFHVSEYADRDNLVCAKCGAAIPAAEPQAVTAEAPAPRLRLATAQPPMTPVVQPPSAELTVTQAWMRRRQQNAKKKSSRRHLSLLTRLNSSTWLNWAIFIILAGVGIYFRFFAPLSAAVHGELRYWGAMGLLACHITIIISAFSDETFQGILCLLVPGYSLYYLFSLSDEHLLRAIMAALALAFGLDAWQYLNTISKDVFDGVNRWMQAGGDTSNRRIYGH